MTAISPNSLHLVSRFSAEAVGLLRRTWHYLPQTTFPRGVGEIHVSHLNQKADLTETSILEIKRGRKRDRINLIGPRMWLLPTTYNQSALQSNRRQPYGSHDSQTRPAIVPFTFLVLYVIMLVDCLFHYSDNDTWSSWRSSR